MIKHFFEVQIKNIKVDDYYYSFDYKVIRNNEEINSDHYDSDHSWQDNKKGFKELLEKGYAVNLALEQTLQK